MKKILFLGSNIHSDSMLRIAKKCGIYTIATDNRPVSESGIKLLADEYWDISVTDIDLLEDKCRKEGICAVTCGASEVCVNAVRDLCKRLDLPFWMDDIAWEYTNNKAEFKKLCKRCGLPVAKEYKLDGSFNRRDLDNIEYPVVVKPVDSCSSLGMHMCSNEEELISGYNDAVEHSKMGEVIVEKCISGLEVGLIYTFVQGEPHFVTAVDSYGNKADSHPMIFGSDPTSYPVHLEKEWSNQLAKLFAELKCFSGTGFVQILTSNDEVAVMEMNYRLIGGHVINEWVLEKSMLESALGEELSYEQNMVQGQQSFIYFVWLKPGKISEIRGIDEITENVPIDAMKDLKAIGTVIRSNTGMQQIFAGIKIASDKDKISTHIDYINKHLVVLDEYGKDMVWRYDYEETFT